MAYFLGRDVNVYINTETTTVDNSIGVTGAADTAMTLVEGATSGMTRVFAQHMHASDDHLSAAGTAQSDITGVEVGLSTMDEDTSYIGQVQPGKVEIKKEYTVSLTRKKYNNLWDVVYNGDGTNNARFGMGNANTGFGTGLVNPKSIVDGEETTMSCYGYRISLQFKTGESGNTSNEEVVCIKNCCITGYSTTLNADGVQEETLEFSSYQPAVYGLSGDELTKTLTLTAGF